MSGKPRPRANRLSAEAQRQYKEKRPSVPEQSLATDSDQILGVWKLESCRSKGQDTQTNTLKYYAFEGQGVLRIIVPDDIDTYKWVHHFRLNEDRCEIVIKTDYIAEDRLCKPEFMHKVKLGIYSICDNELKLCWGLNEFPERMCDETSEIEIWRRHVGATPQSQERSWRAPIQHVVLGEFLWDDDLQSFISRYSFRTDDVQNPIRIHLLADQSGAIGQALERAAEIAQRLGFYDSTAKTFAAEQLLELKNDTWLDENEQGEEESEVTLSEFVARIRLETVVCAASGECKLVFNDGDLFWGHSIVVLMHPDDRLLSATVAG